MKVLRSKCKTRIIFDKDDNFISVRKVSEIDNIVLENGQIKFLNASGQTLEQADWEAVNVPRTSTALEKVTHLTEWITCADACADCEDADVYYDSVLNQVGDITNFTGAYSAYLLSDLSFTFPDDLDCKSRYEIHYHLTFKATTDTTAHNILVDFFVDEARIDEARSAEVFGDAKNYHTVNTSFMVEGNKSGQTLNIGFANLVNATRNITFLAQNIIVKRIK